MAGQDIDYVEQEGKVFVLLPTPELGGVSKSKPAPADDDDDEKPKKEKAKKEVVEEDEAPKKTAPAKLKIHKEEKLMEMEVDDLKVICKELNINPDKSEGKNTRRKLTNLILAKQEKLKAAAEKEAAKASASDDDDEDEKPAKKGNEKEVAGKGSKLDKQVTEVVTGLDEGDLTEAKAVAKLLDLNEDADKKELKKVVAEFMDDPEAPKPKFVKRIVAILEGEEPEEDEKPAKGKGKEKEEVLTDAEDLEEDQEVSIYWSTDKKWYSGTVKKVSKKGILISYEDGEDEYIDEDVHTKIKVLS